MSAIKIPRVGLTLLDLEALGELTFCFYLLKVVVSGYFRNQKGTGIVNDLLK